MFGVCFFSNDLSIKDVKLGYPADPYDETRGIKARFMRRWFAAEWLNCSIRI